VAQRFQRRDTNTLVDNHEARRTPCLFVLRRVSKDEPDGPVCRTDYNEPWRIQHGCIPRFSRS